MTGTMGQGSVKYIFSDLQTVQVSDKKKKKCGPGLGKK